MRWVVLLAKLNKKLYLLFLCFFLTYQAETSDLAKQLYDNKLKMIFFLSKPERAVFRTSKMIDFVQIKKKK
jgi:hypothetical protein